MKKYIKDTILLVGFIVVVLITTGCTNNLTGNVVSDNSNINSPLANSPNTKTEKIEIKGSDTMLQVVSNLAEEFKKNNPHIKISVTGGGSGTGIASLINGEIDIADSSRKIKSEEVKKAKDRDKNAIEIPIARDTLSVIVNPQNPVTQLTIEQVSRIFKGEITNWKELGGVDSQITLYGRQSTSGTYIYFMEEVVKADYSTKMRNMEGNQAILDAVAQDKTAIGYTGIGYVMDENKKPLTTIKTLNIAKDKDSEYITPLDEANIKSYPISRELYQYLANKPSKDSSVYNFMMFIISDDGQNVVEKSGFIKMSAEEKQKVLEILN